MSDNTSCKELLKKVDDEKLKITNKIDLFYENNKSNDNIRDLLYKEFKDEISDFRKKYNKMMLLFTDTKEDIIPQFNFDCSDKITEKVASLENYGSSLIVED